MIKCETYEPETSESEVKKISNKDGNPLLFILGILIGCLMMFMILSIVDYNFSVNEDVNQTILNETYIEGYNHGIVSTSQNFFSTGLIPMFNITEDGLEYLGDLNITEYLRWA